MFAQFRAQYPTGGLISELMSIQDGTYIIRVLVQVGGVTLASGMAGASSPEVAEDQARLRALDALGLPTTPPGLPPTSTYGFQVQLMAHGNSTTTFAAQGETPELLNAYPEAARLSLPEQRYTHQPNLPSPDEDLYESPENSQGLLPSTANLEPYPDIKPPQARPTHASPKTSATAPTNGRRSPAKQTQPSPAPPAPDPIDFSDVIAQTTIEMKRLGWSTTQGRQYLKRTYQKQSRQELTDEELLEFLEYLETQSSPEESPF